MRAVAFTETGGPEVLRVMELPDPQPGPGQVRLRVAVSGVNFRDIGVRKYGRAEGSRVPEPVVTGIEAAGVVDALGEGVTHLRPGQRVATICPGGGYGDLLVVPAAQVIPLPDSVSDLVGGTFAMTGLTAWHLLHTAARVQPGDTVLVHAAAGGVGVMLLQLARRCGVTVLATVGSAAKAETARRFGADAVINYREQDFAAAVRELTGGRGVDVVIDGVGATTCRGNLEALRVFGRLVSFGRASGEPQLGLAELQQKSLQWAYFGIFHAWQQLEVWQRGVAGLLPLVASGAVDPYVTETYPLAQAAEAHRRLEQRLTQGKLALLH
ncbi:MAG: quinone oxidoreductase [Candidatus Tectimicrobiota bacterium]|nr:MAG: quinone oxidoreductase [Candidatus Tectomicrobia bacterium]